MTRDEFAERMRRGGMSDDAIARELESFEENKAKLREHQAKFATPVPREWTAAELAECDTSTLKRQRETSASTGELLSDCEVAFFLAQTDTSVAIIEMQAQDKALLTEQLEFLEAIDSAINRVQADKVVDQDEFAFMCSVAPQWIEQVRGFDRYIASLGRSDLQGLEVDVIRKDRIVSEIYDACVQNGLLSAGLAGQPTTIPLNSSPASSKPDASVLNDPSSTEEEIFKEVQKDPCFRGRVPSATGSGWTYLWDIECQMNN